MLIAATIIIFSLINQVQTFKVHGRIKFEEKEPILPKDSWLTVIVKDTSIADRRAVELGRQMYKIKSIPKRIRYKIKNAKSPESVNMPGYEIALSAIINVGWKPNGNQWIRRGDYLSQSVVALPYIKGKRSYKVNIPVTKYD